MSSLAGDGRVTGVLRVGSRITALPGDTFTPHWFSTHTSTWTSLRPSTWALWVTLPLIQYVSLV